MVPVTDHCHPQEPDQEEKEQSVTDHCSPQQEPDQEQKVQNETISSAVVNETNVDHQEQGEGPHTPPRPLVKKWIQILAFPAAVTAVGNGLSPTKAPAAA
jgi:hypothetical protein